MISSRAKDSTKNSKAGEDSVSDMFFRQESAPCSANISYDYSSTISSDSTQIDPKAPNKCSVCQKKLKFRKKNLCSWCKQPVCNEHSQKKRPIPGSTGLSKVCDRCDEQETKNEIKLEIETEIKKLREELQSASDINERLNREFCDKTGNINLMERKVQKAADDHKRNEKALLDEFEEEKRKGEETQQLIQKLTKEINDSNNTENDMQEKCRRSEQELEDLKSEANNLYQQKTEIESKIEKINKRLSGSLNIEHVKKLLCGECSSKVEEAYRRKMDTMSLMEGNEESFLDRRSVLDNIREFKQSLMDQQQGESKGDCLVF